MYYSSQSAALLKYLTEYKLVGTALEDLFVYMSSPHHYGNHMLQGNR